MTVNYQEFHSFVRWCCYIAFWLGAANEPSSHQPNETCLRQLSQLLNALLESKGGRYIHSCKCGCNLDKRLSRLNVL